MNPLNALKDTRTIKQLLTDAERISREMGEEEPAAEHLLLAAMGLPEGSAVRALGSMGVDADRIRAALLEEQADALVAVGLPRETADRLASPEPLGPGGAARLYGAAPRSRRWPGWSTARWRAFSRGWASVARGRCERRAPMPWTP